MNGQTERLIHILLCEELGSETIPDVTERVLQRALQDRRPVAAEDRQSQDSGRLDAAAKGRPTAPPLPARARPPGK